MFDETGLEAVPSVLLVGCQEAARPPYVHLNIT